MLKTLTKMFRRDTRQGGLASLGNYSDSKRATESPKPSQQISQDDLMEACFDASSEGWPEPDLSVSQSAPGDVDFFEQDTGAFEFFPTTASQRQAILGSDQIKARAQKASFDDEAEEVIEEGYADEADAVEEDFATEFPSVATTQSIRVHATTVEEPQEIQPMPTITSALSREASKEMIDALCKLPNLLERAQEAPAATVEALNRVSNLANTLKSQQVQQREATDDIRNLKSEFDTFLKTVTGSITDLKTMHQAAIDECAEMADDSRQALRSQRRHVVEMRRQQQDAYFRLEDEQNRRIRAHETRTGQSVKRVGMACAAMLVLMTLCVGVFMRYTSSIINSSSEFINNEVAKQSELNKEEAQKGEQKLPLDTIIKGETSSKPKG